MFLRVRGKFFLFIFSPSRSAQTVCNKPSFSVNHHTPIWYSANIFTDCVKRHPTMLMKCLCQQTSVSVPCQQTNKNVLHVDCFGFNWERHDTCSNFRLWRGTLFCCHQQLRTSLNSCWHAYNVVSLTLNPHPPIRPNTSHIARQQSDDVLSLHFCRVFFFF